MLLGVQVLADGIEKHSASLAQALAQVTGSLHASLHDMAACTQEHMRVYDHALTSFADNVDQSVAAMTAFMEKVRKLNEVRSARCPGTQGWEVPPPHPLS